MYKGWKQLSAGGRVVFQGTGRSLLDSRLRGNDEKKNTLPHGRVSLRGGRGSLKRGGNDEEKKEFTDNV